MSDIDLISLLSPLRAEVESKIREQISGPLNAGKRFIYDTVTPIRLNITSDSQKCSLEFLPGGLVQLHVGLVSNPDVSVKGDAASLANAVLKRSKEAFEEAERNGKIVAVNHTWKGEQAMRRVRELLSSTP
jgi:hypothetical protein